MNIYSNFEWYYFDLHCDNGYDVVCTIHPKPFNSAFDIAIFDVFVYKENNILFHHFFIKPANQLQKTESPFKLSYDPQNYIRKNDDKIDVSISDESINLKLNFQQSFKTKPLKTELIESDESESLFKWIVYAPACKGFVDLKFENYDLALLGTGYHDYNSGSANLKKELKYWYWGKYYFDNKLLIYGDIVTRDNVAKKVSLFVDGEHSKMLQSVNVKIDDNRVLFNDYIFDMKPAKEMDGIQFYMTRFLGIPFLVKIIETITHLVKPYPAFKFLTQMINNTRYKRFRSIGSTSENKPVVCFYEEMIF